jgi:hypothetical protein
MKVITFSLDDELNATLEELCALRRLEKQQVIADVLRKYLATERLSVSLRDPALVSEYQELVPEDVALAEEGMAEYQKMMRKADSA